MKKSLVTALICMGTLSAAFVRAETCIDKLKESKHASYIDNLGQATSNFIGASSSITGYVVATAAIGSVGTLPVFLIAGTIAASPYLVGEAIQGIQNRPINRMIRLIRQSENFVQIPTKKPGRLLRKLHQRLQDNEKFANVSVLEVAKAISDTNQDPSKCMLLGRYQDVDDHMKNDSLKIIHLEETPSAQAPSENGIKEE